MGEKNKLSRADVTKMRIMRDKGMTYEAIGKEFNVTGPAVYFALQRTAR